MLIESDIVDETNQPEGKDKDEEKHRIDHPHEDLAEINLPVTVTVALAPCLGRDISRTLIGQALTLLIGRELHSVETSWFFMA